MNNKKLIYRGSVKDIYENNDDELIFSFSDRYSIFDWGEMPDEIEHKGKCLALLADFFFNNLDINHHGLGLCDENGMLTKGHHQYYKVKKVNIIRPYFENGKYDYSKYKNSPEHTLVPLEVVFRFGIPKGSSILSRMEAKEFREELGLIRIYEEGEFLPGAIIEFSTKLENTDRYVSYREAMEISGMSKAEFESLITITRSTALKIKELFNAINITLWDGKFEFSFLEKNNGIREFQLVDSIGPDELRLSYKEMILSKEFLRQYYRKHKWYLDVKESQKIAKEKKSEDWKGICINEFKSVPPHLETEYKNFAESMYQTLTNELFLKNGMNKPFNNDDNLELLLKKYKDLL